MADKAMDSFTHTSSGLPDLAGKDFVDTFTRTISANTSNSTNIKIPSNWTVPSTTTDPTHWSNGWGTPAETAIDEPLTLDELLSEMDPAERRRRAYKILPSGDVDVPAYCMRCGAELLAPAYPTYGVVYSPHTGQPAKVIACRDFEESPEKHDGWVIAA